MSPGQITQWMAYQQIRGPLGPIRQDVYVALLRQAIAASSGVALKGEDALPTWRPVPELTPQAAEELYDAALAAYREAHPDEVVA